MPLSSMGRIMTAPAASEPPVLPWDTGERTAVDPPPGRRTSYVIRHWRGELSLGVSYWVNGALVSLFVAIGRVGIDAYAKASGARLQLIAYLVVGYWGVTILVSVWQIVGVWRSAGHSRARGGRRLWAGLARVMMVLGAIRLLSVVVHDVPTIAELTRMATGDSGIPDYRLTYYAHQGQDRVHVAANDADELELAGGLRAGVADRVAAAMASAPQLTVLSLDSIGGRIGEARSIGALIHARGLVTEVRGMCLSACTVAFLAGKERVGHVKARFGFHRYAFPGLSEAEMVKVAEQDRIAFRAAGVSEAFVDKAFSAPNTEMWSPSGDEAMKAGYLTRIKADPGEITPEDIDRELDKDPMLAALKGLEPASYARLVADFLASYQRGLGPGDAEALGARHLGPVMMKYLSHSSDPAVIGFAGISIRMLDELRARDAGLCVEWITGTDLALRMRTLGVISTGLREEFLRATREAFLQAFAAPQPVPMAADVAASVRTVVQGLTRHYSPEVLRSLGDPAVARANPDRTCALYADLYREVLKLPSPEASRLLRNFFNGG
jgi:hypothetical protein